MSISFIMEMGDLDSENRKVLSGPPSTLQLSFQFVRELFTVYNICIVEKQTIPLLLIIDLRAISKNEVTFSKLACDILSRCFCDSSTAMHVQKIFT